MSLRSFRPLAPLAGAAALTTLVSLSGCQTWLDSRYQDSLPPSSGVQPLKGLADTVSVRRNALAMPLIESRSFHDALFALGYVHASDRLSQMVGLRLMAQGRLAEMAGPGVLEIDRFMRAVNLRQSADIVYKNASPRLHKFFEVYARGVNAYLFRHRDKLPMDLAASGYRPEYWKPEDSALIFCLLNFGLSVNLQEEISSLALAQKGGAEQLAWLLPTYPDEPLPVDEAAKLKGLSLSGKIPGLAALDGVAGQLAALNMLGVAASNNWAIAPQRSRSGKSLLANDPHLPLTQPSLWSFVHLRTPKYQAAGVSVAGIPAVVAGFNGKLAWGMTMVMGDTQDLFLEQVRHQGGRLEYLADGQWQPARAHQETFFVKGQGPVRETFYETRNGPLLNSVLGERKHAMQPIALASGYGLALRTNQFEADQTLDAVFDLSRAQSVEDAHEPVRNIRALGLNMLYADAQHIAWQVTGRYPNRKGGRGLVPSPGWDSQYGWDGYADTMLHPYDQDPMQGWLGTANQRSVPAGYGVQLSNSWFYPERAERIAELAGASARHDARSMIAMQYDQQTPFAAKLKAVFADPLMAQPLQKAIEALPAGERDQAREALKRLQAFDGQLAAGSADAALYAMFLQESARQTFLDELGPEDSAAWQGLVEIAKLSYSAQADHLLGRVDSPFWDDVRTAHKEDKPAILARSLAASVAQLESRLGSNRSAWQWGKLHRYQWDSDSTRLAPYMSAGQRASLATIKDYLDRGPYPAGGDHSTLNVSAWLWGNNFDTWLVPSMRMVVDFGQDEPLQAVNSSGQSGNPASKHYADGIDAWLKGRYLSFPFQSHNLDRSYSSQRLLLTPGR